MDDRMQSELRKLPQVDALAEELTATDSTDSETLPHELLLELIRDELAETRSALLDGRLTEIDTGALRRRLERSISRAQLPSLRPVVNATGIILHTNLGRSVLAASAIQAMTAVAGSYSTLEYNIETRNRGSRQQHCESLLRLLSGAEAALVVNNNASAVLLVLSALAKGHEVIVSRGELIEIGGSFRIPDIMALSEAKMIEVGTTNKTHIRDYENALSEQTALVCKVHPSNYRIEGFSESVDGATLAAFCHQHGLLLFEDQGSGTLFELSGADVTKNSGGSEVEVFEPSIRSAIEQGCDLVSCSGDKLLGGPQAGIIVGRAELIEQLRSHPLMRALRPDKLSLAALEATLRLCLDRERAFSEIPTLAMLSTSLKELQQRAEELCAALASAIDPTAMEITIVPVSSMSGGGALPTLKLESRAVTLQPKLGSVNSLDAYLACQSSTPIIARVQHEQLLLDVRTLIGAEDVATIVQACTDWVSRQQIEKPKP